MDTQYSDADKNYTIRVAPLFDSTAATYSATVWLLGAAVGCLLLISCANVANLIFARGLERRREMAIRSTLGSSRWRLVTQSLLETTFLSMLGGVAGLVIALLSIGLIKNLSPDYLNRFRDVHLDNAALIFIFLITALVSLLSGLLGDRAGSGCLYTIDRSGIVGQKLPVFPRDSPWLQPASTH
jgi:putative ABC transport system permease protein